MKVEEILEKEFIGKSWSELEDFPHDEVNILISLICTATTAPVETVSGAIKKVYEAMVHHTGGQPSFLSDKQLVLVVFAAMQANKLLVEKLGKLDVGDMLDQMLEQFSSRKLVTKADEGFGGGTKGGTFH
jgi:hypothetical protein